jgi:hypothetical protein
VRLSSASADLSDTNGFSLSRTVKAFFLLFRTDRTCGIKNNGREETGMLLNDQWTMVDGERRYDCRVPCSALDTLIREGVLPDPYYRDQERIGTEA